MNKTSKFVIGLLTATTIAAGIVDYKLRQDIVALKNEIVKVEENKKMIELKHQEINNQIGKELMMVKNDHKEMNEKVTKSELDNQFLVELFNQFNGTTIEQLKSIPRIYGSPFPYNELHEKLLKLGLPSTQNLWFYESYISSLNFEKRTPNWVMQRIEINDFLNKVADRKNSYFNNKTIQVPNQFKQENKSYYSTGWSKGHMVPAGDNIKSQESMNQTFLLNANIVPQDLNNNQNFWYRLESFCKNELAKKFNSVTVISGPIYHHPNLIEQLSPEQLENRPKYSKQTEKKFVKYEVIGENNIAVPNYLYKIILAEPKYNNTEEPSLLLGSFIIPNEPIPPTALLTDYQVPLHEIELKTGLQFCKKLNFQNGTVKPLCEEDPSNCQMMTEKQLLPRLIGFCRSVRDVNDLKKEYKHAEWDDNLNQQLSDKLSEIKQQDELKKLQQLQTPQ